MLSESTPPTCHAGPDSASVTAKLQVALAGSPQLGLALVFGSVASGRPRADSDLDIAVAADHALSAVEKMDIIAALAECTGRPIDLIDLKVVGEPLLQITSVLEPETFAMLLSGLGLIGFIGRRRSIGAANA